VSHLHRCHPDLLITRSAIKSPSEVARKPSAG
jgi:hypothetical protein